MLKSAEIVAFAATADAAESMLFYRDTLGLRLVADEPYALVFDANGTMLRIQKAESVMAVPYTTLGWTVDDIFATLEQLVNGGVMFERFSGVGQDENGVAQFPGGAKVAWFKDPDGNRLSITQLP